MSHLRNLVLTPFDLGTFVRVTRQSTSRTLVHLLLLVLLATTATTVSLTLDLRGLVRRLEPHLDKLPTITIRDGKASADVEQPWVRTLGSDSRGRTIVLIIDTTHQGEQRRDFGPNEVGLALYRTTLTLGVPDQPPQELPLDKIPDTKIGPDDARRLIDQLLHRVPYYLALVVLLWYLFAKGTQAVILALFAMAGASRRPLGFGRLFAIGVYALTPAIL